MGLDPATDRERRLKNPAVAHMAEATAKGLMHYAKILKESPLKA
ncbi:MAG: hypothetical protein WDN67_02845 [Candidatus Moraniibacteriota bacterium]